MLGASEHHQASVLAPEWLTSAGLLYSYQVANLQGELGRSIPLEIVYGCGMKERGGLVRLLDTENLRSNKLSLTWVYLTRMQPTWAKQNQPTAHHKSRLRPSLVPKGLRLLTEADISLGQVLHSSLSDKEGVYIIYNELTSYRTRNVLGTSHSMLMATSWGINCDPILQRKT